MQGSSKRSRRVSVQEAVEQYAALFRQKCERAVLRLERNKRVTPFDRLVVLYAMYFLNTEGYRDHSLYRQAQDLVVRSTTRVTNPDVYTLYPLDVLLDRWSEEADIESLAATIKDAQELAEAREELGDELANVAGVEDEDEEEIDDAGEWQREGATATSGALWGLCAAYLQSKDLRDRTSFPLNAIHSRQVEAVIASVPDDELPALAADCLALMACPDPVYADVAGTVVGCTPNKGLDTSLYAAVRYTAQLTYFRAQLKRYEKDFRRAPPPLTEQQAAIVEASQLVRTSTSASLLDSKENGVALDFIPDETYLLDAAAKANEAAFQEDEGFFKDEVHDYYLRAPSRHKTAASPAALVKPHRFCKIKQGYSWSQYNKTHYTRANPPPRTVLWYEFTLFYPLLVNDKKIQWSRIYRIEDVEPGFNEEYCLIVFSPGPPYADVAYRILRMQWDPRPGGVRCSIDGKGKFKLFFRFSNSCYKR